jgi:uncharacterized damage-inducible protein DinB
MLNDLKTLFQRDLQRLIDDLAAYPDDASVWALRGEIKNSAGTLALHLIGNLNHYLGARLGETGYVRQRDLEFSTRDVPRAELLTRLRETSVMVGRVLDLPLEVEAVYPEKVLGSEMTVGFFLVHLFGHLNWHRGQVNYHRRLVTA